MGAVGDYLNSLKQFNKLFWVVISLEGLERGAYYGMMALAAVHMAYNLGLSSSQIGTLMSLLMVYLYFIPIVSAVIGERIGYKKVLKFAFVIYILGNLLFALPNLVFRFSTIGNFVYLVFVITCLGIAGGSFKPIVSATIAKGTRKEQRNFAYSIYYWIINVGAFCVPLSIGIIFIGVSQVYIPVVFIGSAVIMFLNLLITIKFYTEPVPPDTEKQLVPYLISIFKVLKDWRFTLLLLIYSGFWFLFGQNHSYLPIYMMDFKIMPFWFNAALLAAINPLIIITTGPILAKIVEKHDSLQIMMVGLGVFILGFCILGLIPIGITLVLGIIIFSLGEFMTHPNFIAYVSKIAPKEKIAIYMGMIFLPTGLGLVLGNFFGGFLYRNVAEGPFVGGPGRPTLYWAINISIVIFVLVLLLLYNRFVAPGLGKYDPVKVEDSPTDVQEIEEPVKVPVTKAFGDRIIRSNFTPMIIAIFIPIVLFIGVSYGTVDWYRGSFTSHGPGGGGVDNDFDPDNFDIIEMGVDGANGNLAEGSRSEIIFRQISTDEGEFLQKVTISVRWEDEPDIDGGGLGLRDKENQPDEFALEVTVPANPDEGGSSPQTFMEGPSPNNHGSPGIVSFSMVFDHEDLDSLNGTGSWQIVVICGSCGDWEATGLPLPPTADDGNNYELTISTFVYVPSEEEE